VVTCEIKTLKLFQNNYISHVTTALCIGLLSQCQWQQ